MTVLLNFKSMIHIEYWVSEKDMGQSDALNKGFGVYKGDIYCW